MKQQTAVEWLEEKLKENLKHIVINNDHVLMESFFLQAKEMEREQIEEAFIDGQDWDNEFTCPEEYYEQTYGGEGDTQIFFTKDDMRNAFQAGEVSKNRAILRDEGYDLNSYDLPNIDGFEDWIENYA